ncbi:hypothetical protein [Acinetobacter sp. CFCC 10889]|uniref:hypothetical protein n=1 Tax=Acinetobacter sp. CFCC 10889 TaxID=1775557 RepID=UPI000DD069B9|nr:hypothetical protein [Acinetobacter sp. CFCC 10889]
MKIKILSFTIFTLLATTSWADKDIKPVIQGKTYSSFEMNIKTLPKPIKIIKGEPDECNGGNFPDQHDFGTFTVNDNNQIQTVHMLKNNAVIFYGKKLDASTTKSSFLKNFKNIAQQDEDNPNRFFASSSDDEYKSIQFYFKNNRLDYYRLWENDC